MFRPIAALLPVLVLIASSLQAESALHRLDTTEEGKAWEAVGRLDIGGIGFCTGTLIAPDLVLTAAHCLFDNRLGTEIDPTSIEFRAGWRNGRASAYRQVARAVIHPDYNFNTTVDANRVRNDVALLELQRPIQSSQIAPFGTSGRPRTGDTVSVVSYAMDRADAPSLQETCEVMARQKGVLIFGCDVDFGSSGAPIFSFIQGEPQIVSVVSAKADSEGRKVAIGTALEAPLAALRAELAAGHFRRGSASGARRVIVGGERRETGAKFVRTDGS